VVKVVGGEEIERRLTEIRPWYRIEKEDRADPNKPFDSITYCFLDIHLLIRQYPSLRKLK
jgi:hypothetical protein